MNCATSFSEADVYDVRTKQIDMTAAELQNHHWAMYKAASESFETSRIFTLRGRKLCLAAYCAITGTHLKSGIVY